MPDNFHFQGEISHLGGGGQVALLGVGVFSRLIPVCILSCRKGQPDDMGKGVFTHMEWQAYFNI